MFTVICFFRVEQSNIEKFLKITKKSGDILVNHGTLEHHIYFARELTGRQGSMGLLNLVEMEENEELLLGQSVFESEEHYHSVMKDVGFDDMIHYLDDNIKDIVEMNRVVTSSFTTERVAETN
ncbi:DUF1428 family protein [Halobacillus litoralis]|uniref:DUF1428 family protein n=1 Tax=Halobacillus litoralis TaxID=45668 RepID=UPI001CD68262|nr:DUF1428 family protein [Halobacillus litoralis]MCA1022310.1 DUF1428 family protein [Halobacillus litoralis]